MRARTSDSSVTHTPRTSRPVVRGASPIRRASSSTARASPTSTAGCRHSPWSRADASRWRRRCRPVVAATTMVGTATSSTPRENSSLTRERREGHDRDECRGGPQHGAVLLAAGAHEPRGVGTVAREQDQPQHADRDRGHQHRLGGAPQRCVMAHDEGAHGQTRHETEQRGRGIRRHRVQPMGPLPRPQSVPHLRVPVLGQVDVHRRPGADDGPRGREGGAAAHRAAPPLDRAGHPGPGSAAPERTPW